MLTHREYRHIKVTVNIISILCVKSYSVREWFSTIAEKNSKITFKNTVNM